MGAAPVNINNTNIEQLSRPPQPPVPEGMVPPTEPTVRNTQSAAQPNLPSREEMERYLRAVNLTCGNCSFRKMEGSGGLAELIKGDQVHTSCGTIPRSLLLPTPHIVTTPMGHKRTLPRTDILPTDEGSRIGIIYIPKVNALVNNCTCFKSGLVKI